MHAAPNSRWSDVVPWVTFWMKERRGAADESEREREEKMNRRDVQRRGKQMSFHTLTCMSVRTDTTRSIGIINYAPELRGSGRAHWMTEARSSENMDNPLYFRGPLQWISIYWSWSVNFHRLTYCHVLKYDLTLCVFDNNWWLFYVSGEHLVIRQTWYLGELSILEMLQLF